MVNNYALQWQKLCKNFLLYLLVYNLRLHTWADKLALKHLVSFDLKWVNRRKKLKAGLNLVKILNQKATMSASLKILLTPNWLTTSLFLLKKNSSFIVCTISSPASQLFFNMQLSKKKRKISSSVGRELAKLKSSLKSLKRTKRGSKLLFIYIKQLLNLNLKWLLILNLIKTLYLAKVSLRVLLNLTKISTLSIIILKPAIHVSCQNWLKKKILHRSRRARILSKQRI